MLLSSARVFQGTPPGKFTILLNAPKAEQERTVPHFFSDHASLPFQHIHCIQQTLGVVLYWQAWEAWLSPDQASLFCLAIAPSVIFCTGLVHYTILAVPLALRVSQKDGAFSARIVYQCS